MTRASLRTSFKVKGQGHRPTNADAQKCAYLLKKVGAWMEDVDLHQWQVPSKFKGRSKSHCLYVSSLLLLNSGNKMLYLCRVRRAGAYHVG